MSRSIRVAPEHIQQVNVALRRHGFPSRKALYEELGISRATTDKFFTGKPVDYSYFVEISERLGLDWHAIAYIEEAPPIQVEPPPPTDTPPTAKDLGINWRQVCQDMLSAQNQRRLTTNPLTAGDGVAFELDEIYVPLGLVERKQRHRVGSDVAPEQGSQLYVGADFVSTQDEIVQTFQQDEFFDQVLRPGRSRRIAIVGEPGAGKTTLLQKIATWVLDNTSDLPIWISLADLQGKTLEQYLLEDWLKAATRKVRVTEAMQDALGELFNSKRVWLLLDAVDEMSIGAYGNAPLQWIANQITGWVGDTRVVLTCRLNVWDAGKNALEAFETYRNLDFSYGDAQTPDQVGQFIKRWFKSKPQLAEQLRTELDQPGRERIKDAVKNPLRLALLCRTWALGQGGLPNTKAGLYQQFTEALYEWKQDRFPTSSTQRQELHQALGELAKRAISEEKTKFRLRHRLICSVLGKPDEEFFQLALQLGWLNQVGVAAEVENLGEKVYAFYHPTFQEYFAAQAIDDWHYFLNHTPHNPALGNYRIFEQQWKEVILLWLGREDLLKEQKEALIRALVEFEDGCKDFYRYRAYFLAAAGIAELGNCSYADQIVEQIVKWGFGYFNLKKHKWVTSIAPIEKVARATLIKTQRNKAIMALAQLINLTQNESICRLAAESLGEIDPGNQTALMALAQLIEFTENEEIRKLAAESLEKIDPVKQTVIAALVQVIESTKYEDTRQQAAEILGKIGSGNPQVVVALVQLIESTQDEDIRWQVAEILGKIGSGNPQVIAALVRVIESTEDEDTRRQAAEGLGKIDPGNQIAITTLVQLVESAEYEYIRQQAAEGLGKIDPGNQIAITTLVQLIESTEYESTRWQAVESLGEIGTGSQIAIAALVQLIESTKNESIRRFAAENLGKIGADNSGVIAALVQLIESTEDEDTRKLAAESLGKIGTGNKQAITTLVQVIESTEDEFTRREAISSLVKIGTNNELAIAALMQLVESTQNEFTLRLGAESLGKIDPGNRYAITALVQVIQSTQNKFTLRLGAESLGEIGCGNEQAIAELGKLSQSTEDDYIRQQAVEILGKIGYRNQSAIATLEQLMQSTKDEFTRSLAAENLGKIDPGNQSALTALVQLIESAQNNLTRWQAADSLGEIASGNETALAVLLQLIESAEDEFTRREAADSLKKILRDEQMAEIVTVLTDYLSDETEENNRKQFDQCYKLIWYCVQNMTYPAFYQAWHKQTKSNHR